MRCALRSRARCIVRLDGVPMSADELKGWARRAEQLDTRLAPQRQVRLDGSLEPLCVHRSSKRTSRTVLLRNGSVGTVDVCRCGFVRAFWTRTDGQRQHTDWCAPGAHPAIP